MGHLGTIRTTRSGPMFFGAWGSLTSGWVWTELSGSAEGQVPSSAGFGNKLGCGRFPALTVNYEVQSGLLR